jgi:CheY-specific phosphatase CheX
MNEYHELGLVSYDVLPDGKIVISFTDNLAFEFASEQTLDQDCSQYDAEVVENLRKYIVCYCANFGGEAIEGKTFVFDLAEPNGNIVRIV